MTETEARIMRAIIDHGPMTSRELHVKADISETSARTLPAQLAYNGFLEKRRNAYVITQQGNRWAKSKRGQSALNVPGLPEMARV